MSRLIIQIPDGEQVAYELTEPTITIGRHESNSIVIPHASVSSRHASFTRMGTHYRLKDLGSTNKTWIRGVAVSEVLLDGNFDLRFGLVESVYEGDDLTAAGQIADSEESQRALAALVAERDAALNENAELKEKLAEEQKKVLDSAMQARSLAEQSAKIEALSKALEEKQTAIAELEKKITEAQAQAAELQKLKGEFDTVNKARDEQTKLSEQLQSKLQSLEAAVSQGEMALTELKAERERNNAHQVQQTDTISTLQKSIATLQTECDSLRAERDRWSKKSGEQHAEMESLREQVSAAQLQISNLKSAVADASARERDHEKLLAKAKRESQMFAQPMSMPGSVVKDPQAIFSSAANGGAAQAEANSEKATAIALPSPATGFLKSTGPHTVSISKMKTLLQRLIQHPAESAPLQAMQVELRGIATWAAGANSPAAVKSTEVLGQLLKSFSNSSDSMTPSALRTVSQSLDTMSALLSSPQSKRSAPFHEGHVIGIDPDPAGRQEISETLQKIALACDCFATAQEALDYCEKTPVDLLIVEMNLPDATPQEFCQRMREVPNCSHAPLLLFTRALSIENRTQFIAAGANDFLAKPIQPAELAARCFNWLLRSKLS